MITDKDGARRESINAEKAHLGPGGWYSADFQHGFERGFDAAWEWAMDAALELASQPYEFGLGWEASVEAIYRNRQASMHAGSGETDNNVQ